MTNYLGKQRLTRILYNYLEQSATEKLSELKRELKNDSEYRKYQIRYKKYRGNEWLSTSIYFANIEFRFEIYAWGKHYKCVILTEEKVIDNDYGENKTQIFRGVAYYDEDFNPVPDANLLRFNELLQVHSIAKKE